MFDNYYLLYSLFKFIIKQAKLMSTVLRRYNSILCKIVCFYVYNIYKHYKHNIINIK